MGVIQEIGKMAEDTGRRLQGHKKCFICSKWVKGDYEMCRECFERNKRFLSKDWFE